MQVTGLISGATPKKSGKFVVRLPRSLHAALEKEAESEATSLNQLVVAKLAVQLNNFADERINNIIQAFIEVRDGYSPDKVLADPELDRKFLRRCRELGLSGTDFDLNWKLLNIRKSGKMSNLSSLVNTKRYTVGRKFIDEFEYASELAVKFLQRTRQVSLDQIICDPSLVEEFDRYAALLAPGFSPLEYRWTALSMRKARRFRKKVDEMEKLPEIEPFGKVTSLSMGKIPEISGIYLFSSEDRRIFIGQTDNLRHRMEKHLEVSHSRGLPDWLWDTKRYPFNIEFALFPSVTRSLRQAMELSLVKKWQPLLNFQRRVA
ncbi:MAG: toxin-antitoxin system HicB family antitoxin [Deltaproteobacteria bacterium]|nr:toxin-antitoxin system HicB family antitoxin [Deltaproteobacteria bacterium]